MATGTSGADTLDGTDAADHLEGLAGAVREAALDAAVTTFIESSGVRATGIVSDNLVPGFGVLFELLPG